MNTKEYIKRTQAYIRKGLMPICIALLSFGSTAQDKLTIGIMNIEGHGVIPDAASIGAMARIEMEKTGRYHVLDKYDMTDLLSRNNMEMVNCYGMTCLLEAGKVMKADKMMSGHVERFGERIAITLKIIDVSTGKIEASNTSEYANAQKEMQRMFEVSIKRLLEIEVDRWLAEQLAAYEEPIGSMIGKVNLSGPRMGVYYTSGIAGQRMRGDRQFGGFGMSPVTTMMGWQQEVQYLSTGNFQCLLEFLFTGAGLESGQFIPSFTFLNGFRMSRQGWEVALGPTFRVVKLADGYYDLEDDNSFDPVLDWRLEDEYFIHHEEYANGTRKRSPSMKNIDHRGKAEVTYAMVFAVGKTFRSGHLNIPLNLYFVPRKEGTVYGMAVGFNVSKQPQRNMR